jgi:gamma-glutamylcyclotransferase (GGCT)/AIG2-like uncharacterized protein YtfP
MENVGRLFVYETLRNPATVAHVLNRDIPYRPAEAVGVKKVPVEIHPGGTYYDLIDSPYHSTSGHVMEVNPEEMELLDNWEDKYERAVVDLHDQKQAFAYVLKMDL